MSTRQWILSAAVLVATALSLMYWHHSKMLADLNVSGVQESEQSIHPISNISLPIEQKKQPSEQETRVTVDPNDLQENHLNVVSCKQDLDELLDTEQSNRFLQHNALKEQLAALNTVPANLMVALLENNKESLNTYLQYSQSSQFSNYANYLLLTKCLQESEQSNVCKESRFANIVSENYQEGRFWLMRAEQFAKNKKTTQAIQALNGFLAASNLYDFHGDSLIMSLRAFNQSEIDSFPLRLVASFAVVVSSPRLPANSTLNFCENQSLFRPDILNLCAQVGEKLYKQGKTIADKQLGLTLQINAYNGRDDDMVKTLSEEKHRIEKQLAEMEKVSNLILMDENLGHYLVEQWIKFGELEAYKNTIEEAVRLSKNPQYDPCNSRQVGTE